MDLTELPSWKKLTKKEQERLKKVFAPQLKQDYNIAGNSSISKKELKKGGLKK